jgi:hypothetical protein
MDFTFGITTDYKTPDRLLDTIRSIKSLNIPNYEILLIGPTHSQIDPDVTQIPFDESDHMWITKKKNILSQSAKYENIVLMHDYYIFDHRWYSSFLEFGNVWDIATNTQLYIDGSRYRYDWVIWDHDNIPRYTQISPDDWTLTKSMYISGSYMIVKKYVMDSQPLNENLVWGQEEDVEWSLRVRDRYSIVFNTGAIVRHNKYHRSY